MKTLFIAAVCGFALMAAATGGAYPLDGYAYSGIARVEAYRYASSPALAAAVVYFKSGSWYKCNPEPDFKYKKYHGNCIMCWW